MRPTAPIVILQDLPHQRHGGDMERGGNEAVEICSRCGETVEIRRIRLFDAKSHGEPMQAGQVRVIVRRVCPTCLLTTEEQIEEG